MTGFVTRHRSGLFLAFCFLSSLYLRAGWPAFIIGDSPHDDLLFVRLAGHMLQGEWLGDYNSLTHAKGPFFSMFLALSYVASVPLKMAEHLFFLTAALTFSLVAGRLAKNLALSCILFFLFAFAPILWGNDLARIVREPVYCSMTLLCFAAFAAAFMDRPAEGGGIGEQAALMSVCWPSKSLWALLFGFAAGGFWLTREEGVWLLPALLFASACLLLRGYLARGREGLIDRMVVRRAAMAAGLTFAMILAVNCANYFTYGVFRNNDFRSSDFTGAYGALSRVKAEDWRRYVVVPRKVRAQIYEVSPAAAELKPYFEGDVGNGWGHISCLYQKVSGCDEILGGWFMWALRDAVDRAGYYRSATVAQEFYERLASEINAACDDGRLDCLAPRATMMPPFRWTYIGDALEVSERVLALNLLIGPDYVTVKQSFGSPHNVGLMRGATRAETNLMAGQFAPDDGERALKSALVQVKQRIVKALAHLHLAVTTVGLALALVVAVLFGWRWFTRPLGILAFALLGSVMVRVALLSFLQVTTIPSINTLYFTSAYPLLLAFVVIALWLGGTAVYRRFRPVIGGAGSAR